MWTRIAVVVAVVAAICGLVWAVSDYGWPARPPAGSSVERISRPERLAVEKIARCEIVRVRLGDAYSHGGWWTRNGRRIGWSATEDSTVTSMGCVR